MPDVASAQDYYPFGMLMPGRTFTATTASNYRYGFNGKEKNDEIEGAGNAYDYGMRENDPRIGGRFWSVDPLTKKYPGLTPYQFASNNPIKFTDLDGREAYDPNVKPHGVTLLEKATVPGGSYASRTLRAGNYDLVGVSNKEGSSYWIARLTFTAGDRKGMYRDDYIVGVDGVFDFIKNAKAYELRANTLEFVRSYWPEAGTKDIGSQYGDMWKDQASNPMTWINLAAAGAASLPRGGAPVGEMAPSEPILNAPEVGNTGSHSTLQGWEELEHQAIMSDNPLSVATSTDGKTFRAVVQNIEAEYGGGVVKLLADLNRQAQKAGASTLEVRGIEIINSDLNKIFQDANGKTIMGYQVNYSRSGGYGQVTLTKDVQSK